MAPRRVAVCALRIAFIVSTTACGSSAMGPSQNSVVDGTVVERYGGKPIPGAIVFIKDGPDAGASLSTDSKGYFELVGLKRLDFSLFFVASGFTDSIIDVAKNSLGEIGLSPLFTDYTV